MAKMKNGINGSFSGRVGNVVGSNWRGISYIRNASFKKTRVSTPAQMKQQAKFAMMTNFLTTFKSLLSFSFNKYPLRMTGNNEALSYNLKHGIVGDYPNLAINYPEILLSRGKLSTAAHSVAKAGEAGAVDFSWVYDEGENAGSGSDYAILVIYNPLTKKGSQVLQGSLRQSGAASLTITANRGCAVETWIAFMSFDTKNISNSVYTGTVITS